VVVNVEFKLGEVVYLRTDTEQLRRIVTEVNIAGNSMADSVLMYELSQGENISKHYSSEMARRRDDTISLGM